MPTKKQLKKADRERKQNDYTTYGTKREILFIRDMGKGIHSTRSIGAHRGEWLRRYRGVLKARDNWDSGGLAPIDKQQVIEFLHAEILAEEADYEKSVH